jgi:site-specific recombinase XerD
MSLLYYAGLRISELCSLTVSSVRPEHFRYKQNLVPAVIVRDGKGGKDRAIPLSSEEVYGDYLAWERKRACMKAGHDALFLNKLGEPITAKGVNYLVKKYAEKAGMDKRISPHTLRHTFATRLAMEGTRLDLIQNYLGHNDLRSTLVYAHITDDEYASGVGVLDMMHGVK